MVALGQEAKGYEVWDVKRTDLVVPKERHTFRFMSNPKQVSDEELTAQDPEDYGAT